MALARELVGVGFAPGQAAGIGGQSNTVAATGSVQGDAAVLNAGMNVVTGADGTKGVILSGQPGDEVWVFSNQGVSALKVYPPSGAAIAVPGTGAGSANAAYSLTAFGVAVFKCFSSTQWLVDKSA